MPCPTFPQRNVNGIFTPQNLSPPVIVAMSSKLRMLVLPRYLDFMMHHEFEFQLDENGEYVATFRQAPAPEPKVSPQLATPWADQQMLRPQGARARAHRVADTLSQLMPRTSQRDQRDTN